MIRTEVLPRATRLRDVVGRAVMEPARSTHAVGLEIEGFAMTKSGSRLHLNKVAQHLAGLETRDGPDPSFGLAGAKLTFEPGGQIEVSSDPSPTISDAIDAQLQSWAQISDLVPARMVFAGLDAWNDVKSVPLQLRAPRYRAMDHFLGARSRSGRLMMRHTASVQINLDGGGAEFRHRMRVAQAIAPLVTATFATSPVVGAHSGRARVWQQLDPTRTGFLDLSGSIVDGVVTKAMEADVLVVRRNGRWAHGIEGFDFADWVARGHPEWGAPEEDDLLYHLTTLFPEVRARQGTLELRAPDSVPLKFMPALVVLVGAAVYWAGAEILELMRDVDLPSFWQAAAVGGLEHPGLAELSSRVWRVASTAAQEMTSEVRSDHIAITAEFVDRYVDSGRTLSLKLRDALATGPIAGLEWAS